MTLRMTQDGTERAARLLRGNKQNGTLMAVAYPDVGQLRKNQSNQIDVNQDSAHYSIERFPWFALRVRSRCETSVAQHLEGNGYESFVPTYKSRKRWSDRIKQVNSPLFPGYLFCRFDPQYRLPILKTPGTIEIVGYNRSPIPIDENEVAAIQIMVASGLASQTWPFLEVGHRVRIEWGPLRGLEGILVKAKGDHQLVLSVTLLQRSVAVEIDSAYVASLNSSPSRTPQRPYREPYSSPLAV